MYDCCIIGGIICSCCKYPIATHDGYRKEISKHERSSKKHSSVLDYNNRCNVVKTFMTTIDEIAHRVVSLLPNENAARNVILEYIDTSTTTYKYCEKCAALVFNPKHKSNSHMTSCKTEGSGYASKFWLKKNPKIIPSTFSMHDLSLFCAPFVDAIRKELNLQGKQIPVIYNNDCKVEALSKLINDQQQKFAQNENSIALQCIEIDMNPDLWLVRTGWNNYLNGFTASVIHNTTKAFHDDNEQLYRQMEQNLESELNESVQYVRNMDRLHQIFHEVERRPNTTYPNKPFRIASVTAFTRYVCTIRMLFRIIIRTYNYQKYHESEQRDYPRINFTHDHSMIIEMIQRNPDTKANYSALLLALAEQTYTLHPYQCALICTIAFTSVNRDGSFKSPAEFTGTFAALLGIFKVLVIRKSMTEATDEASCIELAKIYTLKYLSHPDNIRIQ